MNIVISHKSVQSVDEQDSLVEQRLFALGERIQIDEARVVFERRWEDSPPYRVGIHIVTPGPDVMAEGVDQTLNAAVIKSLRQLDGKLRQRQTRRTVRVKSNLTSRSPSRQAVRS